MTNCDDNNGVWVIKDGIEHFAYENSIHKTDKDTVGYISYHAFGDVYMGYMTKERCLYVLEQLNQAKMKWGFDVEFHVEQVDRNELREQRATFKGDNMILMEKKIEVTTLKPRKKHKNIDDIA